MVFAEAAAGGVSVDTNQTTVRRDGVGHGLATAAGDTGGDLRGGFHEEVAQRSGDADIVGSQRDAHPLLGVVVLVNGVVAPVGAVVVPDVVVGIRVFIFHAPTSAQGVGHPLSDARNSFWRVGGRPYRLRCGSRWALLTFPQAPVAQPDRVSASEAEGCAFDPRRVQNEIGLAQRAEKIGSGGWDRTSDQCINSASLYR